MIGQSISRYRIIEKLGEGGMGVVYKAEDTRLRRAVALKLLPAHVSSDVELRARFLREAQAAAGLNHPNVCTIHEVDEEHGFLAMELVEGETVLDKLRRRPLPLRDALRIAIEAAQGLQAAHQKCVVHRDVKSTNLMVTAQGAVKVMDFGLARAAGRTRLTKSGMSMGTPAYMSPEQARGEVVDARSDIWSLAVVLYEMVSGELPFRGETEAAVTHSILYAEPEPLTALRAGLPLELDHIVAKALAKDAAERYQHIDEMLVDLRRLNKAVESGATARVAIERRPVRRERLAWLLAAAGLLLAVLVAFVAFRQQPESPGPVRFSIPLPEGAHLRWSDTAAVSPDGRYIAFTAVAPPRMRPSLWIRPLDSPVAREVPGAEGFFPFWSPDSKHVAFFSYYEVNRVPVSGGPISRICATNGIGFGGAWAPDGTIVFSSQYSPLARVAAEGGDPQPLSPFEPQERAHVFPRFLPDGRRFVYFVHCDPPEKSGVYLGSLDSPQRTFLTASTGPPNFTAGRLFYFQGATLMQRPFDVDQARFSGEPEPVIERVVLSGMLGGPIGMFSISPAGVAVWRQETGGLQQITWRDRGGEALAIVGESSGYFAIALSPDERWLAVTERDPRHSVTDIWLIDLERGAKTRLTDHPGGEIAPAWSPDGGRVAFNSDRQGTIDLYQKMLGGVGADELVAQATTPYQAYLLRDWSPDGKYWAISASNTAGQIGELQLVPVAGERKAFPFLPAPLLATSARFSPDGRWIAYTSPESGRSEVYVRRFTPEQPERAVQVQVSTNGGSDPQWRGDGRELYFIENRNLMAAGITISGDVLEAGEARPLFEAGTTYYAAARDGKRFLVVEERPQAAKQPLEVLLHWRPGVKP